MTSEVTFSKLRSGDWGISGPVDLLETGNVVTVTKKSGATCKVTVGKIVWDNDMEGVATIKKKEKKDDKPKPVEAKHHRGEVLSHEFPSNEFMEKVEADRKKPGYGAVYRTDAEVRARKDDEPEPGKVYRLTGDSSTPSVMRGDPLADCEVASELKPKEDETTWPSELLTVTHSETLSGWGVCTECGVPGIRDVGGLGLSCGCAF